MADSISYKDTGYFSKIICDYLDEKESIDPFYGNFSNLAGFKDQLIQKENSFTEAQRVVLYKSMLNQYAKLDFTARTKKNIEALKAPKTFSITTGHQLNLFTGPLYFLYKIIGTINLCKKLKTAYPSHNFVPIYWMATEDHDFEEIQYFNFNGAKVNWNRASGGAVGRLSTTGLDEVLTEFAKQLGNSINAQYLINLFKESYLSHDNLAAAHRYLVNELFGAEGLVIVDGDDIDFKHSFIGHIKDELLNISSFQRVSQSVDNLSKDYNIQVNPREINLFYLTDNYRERIVKEGPAFSTADNAYQWTEATMLAEVDAHPDRFSPNVIMRPLYQEYILPNLCYIGGGGELAYWFQLKGYFDQQQVPFPILLLRNSVLCLSEKQQQKANKLGLNIKSFFLKPNDLLKLKTKELSKLEIDFSPQKSHLEEQFKGLEKLAEQTDKSFIGAVRAQKKKQIKGLMHLEKRLLKAEKRRLKDVLVRISILQSELFPNDGLEERTKNFSELYLSQGHQLIDTLIKELDPLNLEFSIINLDEV